MIETGSAPKVIGSRAGDAMPFGVHNAYNTSSKHKKLVSGVLHLKKESQGRRAYPTAYNTKATKAFGQKKPSSKVE